jgi:hypothetical protein
VVYQLQLAIDRHWISIILHLQKELTTVVLIINSFLQTSRTLTVVSFTSRS